MDLIILSSPTKRALEENLKKAFDNYVKFFIFISTA